MVPSRKMSPGLIKLIRGSVALPRPPDHSRPAQSCRSRGLVPQASHWPGSKSPSHPSQGSELFGHCGVKRQAGVEGGWELASKDTPPYPIRGLVTATHFTLLIRLPASSGRKPQAFSCLTKPIFPPPHLSPVLYRLTAPQECACRPRLGPCCALCLGPLGYPPTRPHILFPHGGPSYSNASLSLLPPTDSETLCLPLTCQLLSPSLGSWCLCPSGTLTYSGQGT